MSWPEYVQSPFPIHPPGPQRRCNLSRGQATVQAPPLSWSRLFVVPALYRARLARARLTRSQRRRRAPTVDSPLAGVSARPASPLAAVAVAGPAKEIRLVGFPRLLIRRKGEPYEITDNGVRYFCQSLHVYRAGFWSMVTNLGIYPEELEVEIVLQDGRKVTESIPVVLELSFTWKIVLLLILWALLGSLYELISAALREHRAELLTSPMPWIKGFCLCCSIRFSRSCGAFWDSGSGPGNYSSNFKCTGGSPARKFLRVGSNETRLSSRHSMGPTIQGWVAPCLQDKRAIRSIPSHSPGFRCP